MRKDGNVKVAICDDEKIFRDDIIKNIKEAGGECSFTEFVCGTDLLESKEQYDIIFLDIEMPGLTGIETAEKLRENGAESEIIFLTSHTEFVYEAFKVRAFRFLSKPLDPVKFSEAFKNAAKSCEKEKIIIEYRSSVTELFIDDIVYIEASGEGAYIYDKRGGHCQSPVSLKEWNERLKSKGFFRIHKAYLVSMHYISSFEKNTIKLIGYDEEFSVARRSVTEFRTAYLDFIKNNGRVM